MKKLLTLILGICLILPCSFVFSGCGKDKNVAEIEKWDGSCCSVSAIKNNVVIIDTAEELAGFANEVNGGTTYAGVTVKLACDMDLLNKKWTPIGYGIAQDGFVYSKGKAFEGIFDGQNHTIYNLNVVGVNGEENGSTGVGLFGFLYGKIENLKVKNASVVGNHHVGTIVGYISDFEGVVNGAINNCHVENAIVNCNYYDDHQSGDKAGVIVGTADKSKVVNCSVTNSQVFADSDAGQMIGYVVNTFGVDHFTGNVAANVVVEWNRTGAVANSGNNINQSLIGRNDEV